jgi:dTDP-L-rhamnose 4-epimerase
LEVARKLREILCGPDPFITNRYRAGDIRHCVADVSRAEQVLGWRATIGIEEGLRGLTDWLRDGRGDRASVQRALTELEGRGLIW